MSKPFGLILPLLSFICIACAGRNSMKTGESILVEANGSVSYKTAAGPEIFVGVSKEYGSEALARADALLDARRQIVQALGVNIAVEQVERILVEGQSDQILAGQVTSDAKTRAVAENILSVKEDGFYIERWMTQTREGVQYSYKVWCLIRYSRAEHERLIAQMIDAITKEAEPWLTKAKTLRREGRIQESLQFVQRLNVLLDGIKDLHPLPPEKATVIRTLHAQIEDLARNFSLFISISELVGGKEHAEHIFEGKLIEALAEEAIFSIISSSQTDRGSETTTSPELMLQGKAEVPPVNDSKASFNIYTAKASISLELVETATGNTLWETSLPGDIVTTTLGVANNPAEAIRRSLMLFDQNNTEDKPFTRLANHIADALK